jgi:hypothetical protein
MYLRYVESKCGRRGREWGESRCLEIWGTVCGEAAARTPEKERVSTIEGRDGRYITEQKKDTYHHKRKEEGTCSERAYEKERPRQDGENRQGEITTTGIMTGLLLRMDSFAFS